jgi:hypothetical protein
MQAFGQILGDQAAVLERCPVNDGLPVGDADGKADPALSPCWSAVTSACSASTTMGCDGP